MAPFSKKGRFDTPGPLENLFSRESHIFKFHREPTLIVSAPDSGPSGQVGNLNSLVGAGLPADCFPSLKWQFAEPKDDVARERMRNTREYLVVVEDLDGGRLLSNSTPLLGVYYRIDSGKTTINGNEIVKLKKRFFERIRVAQRDLLGGFKYGEMDGKVWRAPKTMHRIHFQVIALNQTVDTGTLSEFPTKASFYGAAEGHVTAWGEWVGILETK